MPIFLPLLPHFHIDPLFFGLLVALNLQTASCRHRSRWRRFP
jgi:TRAP-type mannitol/chloroaromatic compound transport system permease large subunit